MEKKPVVSKHQTVKLGEVRLHMFFFFFFVVDNNDFIEYL